MEGPPGDSPLGGPLFFPRPNTWGTRLGSPRTPRIDAPGAAPHSPRIAPRGVWVSNGDACRRPDPFGDRELESRESAECGGLGRRTLASKDLEEVRDEMVESRVRVDGRGVGCRGQFCADE